jgi:hypothetical protein
MNKPTNNQTMKRIFLLAVIAVMIAASTAAQGQPAGRPHTETTRSISLGLPLGATVGYSYEQPLSRRTTVIGGAGLYGMYAWGLFGSESGAWFAAPAIDIEPRFYYGLGRRAAHGRKTTHNAGSFLALQMRNVMPFGYVSNDDIYLTGATFLSPMWGLRRVWGDHLLFEFTAGYTFAWGWGSENDSVGFTCLGIRFGYSF